MKKKNENKVLKNAFIAEYRRQSVRFGIVAAIAAAALALTANLPENPHAPQVEWTKGGDFGEYMAGLHSMHAGDFAGMTRFAEKMKESEFVQVRGDAARAAFIAGGNLDGINLKGQDKTLVPLAIDLIARVSADDWSGIRKMLANKDIFLLTPARIVSAAATGNSKQAHTIAAQQDISEDVLNFQRGFAYAITKNPKTAKKYFDKLGEDFLNLPDFLFIRAFYEHNKMTDATEELTAKFANSPRGSFIADIETLPDWSNYDTPAKQLRAGFVSLVAQNPFVIGTGWGLIVLRTAGALPDAGDDDALNYYLGMNFPDMKVRMKFFDKISDASPFKPFVLITMAQQARGKKDLAKLVKKYPSFAPASARLAMMYAGEGDLSDAIDVADNALDAATNASPKTTAYLLKLRAHLYMLNGDLFQAETDLNEASALDPKNAGLIADKVRLWAKMDRNLEAAYDLASMLIRTNSGDADYWDAIAVVLTAQGEAVEAARIYDRVLRVATDVSSYAEHAGDAYANDGQIIRATAAYKRAIELREDGQINAREVRKKLNSLK